MSSPPAPNRARPGPRPRLTRAQVLETALALIDRGEAGDVSMRRVAEELGVATMTLYGYVRNKEELVEGMAALVFAEVQHDLPAGAAWDARLRADVTALYDFSRRHPQLAALINGQRSVAPGLFRIRERLLHTLRGAGLDETTALRALGVLTSYAIGFGGQAGAPIDHPQRIRELPEADFPHLSAVADVYAVHLSQDAFGFGLELLLAGLRAEAA